MPLLPRSLAQPAARARAPWPALHAAILCAVALGAGAPAPAAEAEGAPPTLDAVPRADITAPGEASPASQQVADLQRSGKGVEALALADVQLAKRPHDAKMLFLRAMILTELSRTDEAIAGFERMTQEFPELPEAYNNIGVLRAGRGELALAEQYLRLSVAARSDYVTAQENLGDLYLTMARLAYERGAQLNPSRRALREKLALARELGTKVRAVR